MLQINKTTRIKLYNQQLIKIGIALYHHHQEEVQG